MKECQETHPGPCHSLSDKKEPKTCYAAAFIKNKVKKRRPPRHPLKSVLRSHIYTVASKTALAPTGQGRPQCDRALMCHAERQSLVKSQPTNIYLHQPHVRHFGQRDTIRSAEETDAQKVAGQGSESRAHLCGLNCQPTAQKEPKGQTPLLVPNIQ